MTDETTQPEQNAESEPKARLEALVMQRNAPGDNCPRCGAEEVDAMTPRTVYACGSSDYDGRPGTFKHGGGCAA